MAEQRARPVMVMVRRLLAVFVIVTAAGVLTYYSICSPLDITDDAARNGGSRGLVLVVRTPVVAIGDNYLVPMGSYTERALFTIPAGTRIKVIKMEYLRTLIADNLSRMQPQGEILDGPKTGETVILAGISESQNRMLKIDRKYLVPENEAITGSRPDEK